MGVGAYPPLEGLGSALALSSEQRWKRCIHTTKLRAPTGRRSEHLVSDDAGIEQSLHGGG